MNRPIPEEARATLPKGYVILGWGLEFEDNDSLGCLAWGDDGDGWERGDWALDNPSFVYAAPEDSEIVKLNERRMLKEVHDELEAEERRGTSEKDFLIAEVKNLEMEVTRLKSQLYEANTRAGHFQEMFESEQKDRIYWYKCLKDELRKVK